MEYLKNPYVRRPPYYWVHIYQGKQDLKLLESYKVLGHAVTVDYETAELRFQIRERRSPPFMVELSEKVLKLEPGMHLLICGKNDIRLVYSEEEFNNIFEETFPVEDQNND